MEWIEDDELRAAVSALAGAADIMRRLTVAAAAGEDVMSIVMKNQDTVKLADRVISTFADHFGIGKDDTLN